MVTATSMSARVSPASHTYKATILAIVPAVYRKHPYALWLYSQRTPISHGCTLGDRHLQAEVNSAGGSEAENRTVDHGNKERDGPGGTLDHHHSVATEELHGHSDDRAHYRPIERLAPIAPRKREIEERSAVRILDATRPLAAARAKRAFECRTPCRLRLRPRGTLARCADHCALRVGGILAAGLGPGGRLLCAARLGADDLAAGTILCNDGQRDLSSSRRRRALAVRADERRMPQTQCPPSRRADNVNAPTPNLCRARSCAASRSRYHDLPVPGVSSQRLASGHGVALLSHPSPRGCARLTLGS
ncbi:hypothetical protein FB451DRAFT_1184998 [Mycena latifolia]|nr:hypothetical protein FB451DRAFT_1184998 [Mycena latifolia]